MRDAAGPSSQRGCRAIASIALLAVLALCAGPAGAEVFLPAVDDASLMANAPNGGWGTPLGTTFVLDGLPPGSSLVGTLHLYNPFGFISGPGGALGGTSNTFQYMGTLDLTGTGAYAGYHQTLSLPPVQTEVHIGPRSPGDPVQSFPMDTFALQGQLPPGDPDFDLLRITGGTGLGMPSPGHTTLKQLPGGNWAVDSFFDITYRIDFVGSPGGAFGGLSGSTTTTARLTPAQVVKPGDDHLSTVRGELRFAENPIPADFFGPGSDPFTGDIPLVGHPPNPSGPLGDTDTVVRRLNPAALPFAGCTDTVPIEIVALSLQSVNPITVTGSPSSGFTDSFFDVFVAIDPLRLSGGNMDITRTNSGSFDSFFDIWTEITFQEVGNPSNTFVLNWGDLFGGPISLAQDGLVPWGYFPPPGSEVPGPASENYFYPQANIFYTSSQFDLELGNASAAIPEPGTLSLLGLGLLACLRRRWRKS